MVYAQLGRWRYKPYQMGGIDEHTVLYWVISFVVGIVVGWLLVRLMYLLLGLGAAVYRRTTRRSTNNQVVLFIAALIAILLAYVLSGSVASWFGASAHVIRLTAGITVALIFAMPYLREMWPYVRASMSSARCR